MLNEDQQAIEQVLSGETAAFTSLVERYQRRLLGLLSHACGDPNLAEDIAQEAFARAYQKLELFSGDSQFYTWLARIAMNLLCSDRRRKRIENQIPREGLEIALDAVGSTNRPDEQMEQSETQLCVRQAIAQLDEERRMVLLLRDFENLDYEAIAMTLDIPIGTVRSRLHRARLELKTILQEKAVQLGLSGQ
ncbi:MAG: sigma-70 family RNA polymerase sigma factor [Planctomycetales bacterium]|nr:sigma-70 family RNA polymerase sigma factor [Planctomycetales bacterium]